MLGFPIYLLTDIQSELAQEKGRLVQLRADFDYNLSLLTQRDEELLRYEETFAGVRQAINTLLADNSQLKVRQCLSITLLFL